MHNSTADRVRLCPATDVEEGAPVAIDLDGFPSLAVYEIDGDYFVTDNQCTHGNGLLSEGFQDGGQIECPFHGGAFNIRTGEAMVFPCQTPVRTYPVEIEDGWITIASPDGSAGRPDG
ncbi:non-heme iron oxygenase ferredoxin subunit [Novosphingobium sp.]|uniref:non-heme iron oxygenase ferredoxin subunit n=1 Tax=Novosphingobium sp. TaxID=1874826 RepID=UPI0035B07F3E